MKTRWSLSSPPLWNSANKRTSSHPSSLSQRRSTFSTLTLWTLVLSLFCLVVPTLSHTLPFLYQRGNRYAYSRNIRPDPCVTKGKERGVCMFAWDCMKANGTHLGTCIDRFYFGSCCKLDSIKRPIKPNEPEHTTVHPNDILDTNAGTPSIVKPSPINKPGFGMTGTTMIDSGVTNMTETSIDSTKITDNGLDDTEFTGLGVDIPDIAEGMKNPTGSGTSDVEIDILSESETAGEVTDTPTVSETPGVGMDNHTESETIGEGIDKHTGSEPASEVTDKPTVSESTGEGIDKPTGSGTVGEVTDEPTVSETTGVDMDKPTGTEITGGGLDNSTGSENGGVGMDKPDMTVSDITDVGVTESEKTKPITVDIGIQVSENDLPGVFGTGEEKNPIGSNPEIEIDTSAVSTGNDIKPIEEESESSESDISATTESPGIYGDGDNKDPSDVIGESQIIGDSAIIFDDENSLGSSGGATNKPFEEATNKPFDEATDNPFDEAINKPLIVDKPQVSSNESVGLPEIEPTTSIKPPSTDSPFGDIDTMLPQEPFTTFSPVKQPSKTDEDDQSIASTVIPPAKKPVKPNNNKPDVDEDDDIEVTTILSPVTDNITVDQNNIEDETESIFTDFFNTATYPSVITIKPKPAMTTPDNETVTEIPTMSEETTVIGPSVSQLPGFTGIYVIPAAINGSDAIKPTGKPEIQPTEIYIPEPSTDKINVDKVPDIIIISTTTESEKPLDPITNIPVVSIKPTTKPEVHVTDDANGWKPVILPKPSENPIETSTENMIIFPGLTDKPKPSENPIETSTENMIILPGLTDKPKPSENPIETSTEYISTQVIPHKPEDDGDNEGDDIEVSASTIATSIANNDILADRLNGSKYSEICGRPVYPTKRIVGGSDASFGEFPWQVSLRQWRSVTFLHKCGAALLNENWAITAAHCVENVQPEQLLLRLGEFDLETAEEPYGFVERKVQIIATHPQFDARTFEYDLALLRFYEPIDFQPNVIPICIPDDDYNFIGDTGYVSGWGRLYEDGPLPSIMQKVPVPVITNPECEAMYKVAGYVEHIPQIFICAGYEAGLKDSCEGDSGGPMVIQRDGVWNLAGVISWGIGCALPNQPGVYTRISAFREWIEKIIVF